MVLPEQGPLEYFDPSGADYGADAYDMEWDRTTILHEFGHLLGFPHEHKLALADASNQATFDERKDFLDKVKAARGGNLPDVAKFLEYQNNLGFVELTRTNGQSLWSDMKAAWESKVCEQIDVLKEQEEAEGKATF